MFKRIRKRRTAAAWKAQVGIATYAPFSMNPLNYGRHYSPEAATAASVENSDRVSKALGRLLDSGPQVLDTDVLALAAHARATVHHLEDLRESWHAHRDSEASQGAGEKSRTMSREWPATSTVQSWHAYDQARQHTDTLTAQLTELHAALVEISGRDITASALPRSTST